jgi:hypothetical protein
MTPARQLALLVRRAQRRIATARLRGLDWHVATPQAWQWQRAQADVVRLIMEAW